ncbi:MAG: cell filamentation protein Fic [Acidobacteria bacterium RIFCSPLOWO2_02_FULL_67_36]|nr:MAG: cell filamentation protein Fic [Acidobacteria bacterium RIFCSPLOWO2_02_FULL_67_36]OFW24563.1 MAG: cell filamentation protein Fic [Acidobacteria bacterium RIFCSPLOWO2_12_FULL_66_21]
MPSPPEKLAEALTALQALQKAGRRVIQSGELSRAHRERLRANGFLQEVMKGWLTSSSPGARAGDSTPWYASFWEFCARYCKERFGDEWHLSPEQSLLLLAENTVIPRQVVVYSPKGTNHNLELPFATSLYDLRSDLPDTAQLTETNGLRLFSPAAALVRIPESFFSRQPIETQVVLAGLRDASDLLRLLLGGGNSVKAGVLAGALRRIGRPELTDEIIKVMTAAGYDARERDPFDGASSFGVLPRAVLPIVGRMRVMWKTMRDVAAANFPTPPGLPRDRAAYLEFVDDIYKSDAYHSLSIEGYSVTPQLIERVQLGNWDPDHHEDDRKSRDALAARGYWQAFQEVKAAVAEIIAGANPGARARATHMDWYRQLFQPCVAAGIVPAASLAGYRNDAVYLRTSRYVPPRWEAVSDAMQELFDLLEQEEHPGVRAVLGHWLFGYVHPYPDGNGRMARFVMNAMLASGGYPWTVIRVEDRDAYLSSLDAASIDMKIAPFTAFVAERVRWSMEHPASKV